MLALRHLVSMFWFCLGFTSNPLKVVKPLAGPLRLLTFSRGPTASQAHVEDHHLNLEKPRRKEPRSPAGRLQRTRKALFLVAFQEENSLDCVLKEPPQSASHQKPGPLEGAHRSRFASAGPWGGTTGVGAFCRCSVVVLEECGLEGIDDFVETNMVVSSDWILWSFLGRFSGESMDL